MKKGLGVVAVVAIIGVADAVVVVVVVFVVVAVPLLLLLQLFVFFAVVFVVGIAFEYAPSLDISLFGPFNYNILLIGTSLIETDDVSETT